MGAHQSNMLSNIGLDISGIGSKVEGQKISSLPSTNNSLSNFDFDFLTIQILIYLILILTLIILPMHVTPYFDILIICI